MDVRISVTFALLQFTFLHVLSGAAQTQELSAFSVSTTRSVLVGRQVSLDPPDATCGARGTERNINGVICLTDCPRKYPRRLNPSIPFASPVNLGSIGCFDNDGMFEDVSPGTPHPGRGKRQIAGQDCLNSFYRVAQPNETYTFWVKPDRTYGTIMQFRHGATQVLNDVEVYLTPSDQGAAPRLSVRAFGYTRTLDETSVPLDSWTLITIQIYTPPQFYNGYTMVMVDDGSPTYLYMPSRFKRATEAMAGSGQFTDALATVYMGVSATPALEGRCTLLEAEVCKGIGYSAYVENESNSDVIVNALRQCRGNDSAIALATLFFCGIGAPACNGYEESVSPCRSLCEAAEQACGDGGFKYDCSAFPPKGRNLNCIDIQYTPEYRYFHGMVKDVRYYESALTQREVVAEMLGKLPEVAPHSECLCPEGYPEVDPDNTLICRAFEEASRFSVENPSGRSFMFVPEAINDKHGQGLLPTSWFGEPGVDPVVITIEMREPVLLYNITVELESRSAGGPATFAIRSDSEWHDIYHVTNCALRNMTSSGDLAFDEVGCLDGVARQYYSIALLRNRELVSEAYPDYVIHPYVREFLTGDALRVTLRGSSSTSVHSLTNLEAYGWPVNHDHVLRWNAHGRENTRSHVRDMRRMRRAVKRASSILTTAEPLANETECKCFSGATRRDGGGFPVCEGASCQCLPGQGSPANSQHTCFPYVFSVEPTYGPKSGGTVVTFIGGYLGNVTAILNHTVASFEVTYSNYTYISAQSPNVTNFGTGVLEAPAAFEITLYNGSSVQYVLNTRKTFTFKEDPVIESIEPLSTFLRGGINQTVVGRHLDSVYKPYMIVTILHLHQSMYEQDRSLCEVLNSTVMICPTPTVNRVPTIQGRKKRQLADNAHRINQDDFQFYLGFQFDGLLTYENVSQVLPEYGIIDVFYDPDIDTFEEENLIRPYRAYKGSQLLTIKGQNLNFGCEVKDYLIEVGRGVCNISDLFTNIITCQPPVTKPEVTAISNGGRPVVLVTVGNIRELVGFLDYYETPFADPDVYIPVIVVIVLVVIAAVAIGLIVFWVRRKAARANQEKVNHNEYSGPPGLWERLPVDLQNDLEPCLRDRDRLYVGRQLGEGNFGSVYAGKYTEENNQTTIVAVKTIKDTNITVKELCEFLEEATLMKDFNHVNVLNLVGVVLKEGRPFVLLPLMENGDLRNFVLNPSNSFTVRDLLQYALQVAQGMEYLACLKFVHRDLAARNCMLSADNVIKIADFGLARDIYSNDYYRSENNRPLPVKWMCPEALDDQRFTTKSDVWSYGVLVWEILTRGKKPYADVDNYAMKSYLRSGRRLEKPVSAPDETYEVLQKCWSFNPEQRPTFSMIVQHLNEMLQVDGDDENEAVDNNQIEAAACNGGAGETGRSKTYERMSRYVDLSSDRHGYQSILADSSQGYVDRDRMLEAVRELQQLGVAPSIAAIGVADDDTYLAPSSEKPDRKNPVPAPRKKSGDSRPGRGYINLQSLGVSRGDRSELLQPIASPGGGETNSSDLAEGYLPMDGTTRV